MTPAELIAARKALTYSQSDLACMVLDTSERTVRKLEAGGAPIAPWVEGKVRRFVLDRVPARLAALTVANAQALEIAKLYEGAGGSDGAAGHARRAAAVGLALAAEVGAALKWAEIQTSRQTIAD